MAAALRHAGAIDSNACREAARARFSADRMLAEYRQRYEALARVRLPRELEAVVSPLEVGQLGARDALAAPRRT
jgi:hypothetical protein